MSRAEQRKKNNKKQYYGIIALLLILVLVVAGYSYRSYYYSNRFLPKTSVNNISVGRLTADEAEDKLQQQYSKQAFVIKNDGKTWKKINKDQLGLKVDFSNSLQKQIQEQNGWTWLFQQKENLTLNNTSYDQKVLTKEVKALNQDLTEFNKSRTPSTNAKISSDSSGFVITSEKQGNDFDTDEVITAFKKDLLAGKGSLDLADHKKKVTITADNKELNEKLEQLNSIAKVKATYQINGESISIPTETITSWLAVENNKITIDQAAVRKYVSQLGKDYNTSKNNTEFASTKQGDVDVPAGTYSWTIATDSETEALSKAILKGKDFTRSPIVQGSADPSQPLIGDTYVEVDLKNQHMWYYKKGKKILDTDIVSGKPKSPTPTGVFYVWNKERNATLRGEDYESPVSYWMPIDWSGVGIHDADWQPTFGGDRWKTGGSHGCVNTPPAVMKTLFENVTVGTPVIVI